MPALPPGAVGRSGPLRHRCARCGEGCHGLRVGVRPDERRAFLESAAKLGVDRPLDGDFVRQEGGTCVFHADGCRLHAELGPMAKPAVCRQFPFVYAGPYVGIDPTCFHADPSEDGDAPEPPFDVLSGEPPSHRPLPWGDLRHGRDVRTALTSAPLGEVAPRIGPLARSMVEPLLRAEPALPEPVWFESRVRTALAFALVDRADAAGVLVGGCQLVAGAGLPPGQGFAAFMRLLHAGAVPDTNRPER